MNVSTARRTRGYSLIEMVLAIGGVTIVLGMCAGLLHALLRLDRAGRASLTEATSLARLARQFRQDVRASTAAKPEAGKGGAAGLSLSRDGGRSTAYRVEGKTLLREESAEGKVKAREGYAVDRLGPVAFEVDGARVRVVLSRRADRGMTPPRPSLTVEARLGKDRDLAAPACAEGKK